MEVDAKDFTRIDFFLMNFQNYGEARISNKKSNDNQYEEKGKELYFKEKQKDK